MTEPATPEIPLVPLTDGGLELELSEVECMSVKALLEANGIAAVVMGASQLPSLPYEILVPSDQLKKAVEVILEAREAGPQGAAEAEAAEEAGS